MAYKQQTKGIGFWSFILALWIVITLISVSYSVFITVVGVGGQTNLVMATPSIIMVGGTIVFAIYFAISSYVKLKQGE